MSRLSLLSLLNAFCALIGIKFLAVSTETSSVNDTDDDTHLLIYFTITILNLLLRAVMVVLVLLFLKSEVYVDVLLCIHW